MEYWSTGVLGKTHYSITSVTPAALGKSSFRHRKNGPNVGENHGRRENDSISDQHYSHALDRCSAAGQIRPPGHAHGARAAGLHNLESRHQTQEYQDNVLPPHVTARVAVEQASTFGWERYVGRSGRIIGMKTFGASAPLKELQRKFGFEPNQVATAAKELLGRS